MHRNHAGCGATPPLSPPPPPPSRQTLKRLPWRHAAQLVLCACELYGGWMTFAPEWLARPTPNPNLSAAPRHVWIYLFFMNALWVLVPLILAWDSAVVITRALAAVQRPDGEDGSVTKKAAGAVGTDMRRPPTTNGAYWVIVAALGLYVVLVPGVIFSAPSHPPTAEQLAASA
jgi:hypothetical protein